MTASKTGFPENITAFILAGGRGRRLQGQDKGLAEVSHKPLVSYVVERIQPQAGQLMISANRNNNSYLNLGFKVIPDDFDHAEFAGPMAGILAGLNACETPFLLSVPCDTPCLPTNLASILYEAIERENTDVATIHDGDRLQPLIMLIRVKNIAGLDTWLKSGGRAVQAWLDTVSHTIVQDNQPEAYQNLNSPEDLERFAQSLCK